MASLALGVVGAVTGSQFSTSGGGTYAALGWAIGSMLGNLLFPPDMPDLQGARVSDLQVQSSAYGNAIPILYGTARIGGNIIWATDLIETAHEEEGDGKGGGGGGSSTTYTYAANFAMGICAGTIKEITKIWVNGKLKYDGTTALPSWIRIYTGDEDQLPDPTIEAYLGVGNVPAYRGMSYAVMSNMQLEEYGNRIPTINFEVVMESTLTMGVTLHPVDDHSADFVYNPLLNEIWTFGGESSGTVSTLTRVSCVDGSIVDTVRFTDSWDRWSLSAESKRTFNQNLAEIYCHLSTATEEYLVCMDAVLGVEKYRLTATELGVSFYNISTLEVNPVTGKVFWVDSSTGHFTEFNPVTKTAISYLYTSTFGSCSYGLFVPDMSGNYWSTYLYPSNVRGLCKFMLDTTSPTQEEYPVPELNINLSTMVLDTDRNSFWVATTLGIGEFNLDSKTLVRNWDKGGYYVYPYGTWADMVYDPVRGVVWVTGGLYTDILGIKTSDLSVYRFEPLYYLGMIMADGNVWVGDGGDYGHLQELTDEKHPEPLLLQDILKDVSTRCGLSLSELEFINITDTVDGLVLMQQYTGENIIKQLQKAYFFDGLESNERIKFVRVGTNNSVVTLTDEDLVI